MTAGWVRAFDDSFDPVTDLRAAYAAGFRVWCRYVGPGSDAKHWTPAQIAAWLACGPDTGVGMLAEATGDEPLTDPASATTHARSAKAAIRALGIDPGQVLCSPAVDRNISRAQATGNVAAYMRNWTLAYGGRPVPYVEVENGGVLVQLGIAAGTFVPAAYSWNESGQLVTPDNAPAHVVQTQEHNGVKAYGGTIDTGHIRTTAPHVYWNPEGTTDMAITNADVHTFVTAPALPADNPTQSLGTAISVARDRAASADAKLDALATAVAALQVVQVGTPIDLDALAAKVVEQLRAHPLAPLA